MGARVAVSLVVIALGGLAPAALAASGEKPRHQDPEALWERFPIGTPTVQSDPQANDTQKPAAAPAAESPRSSAMPVQPSPSSSFPVGAAVGGGAGALVLGLLAAAMLRRRKRGPGGSPAVLGEPQPNPSGGPFSIARVWPKNVEGSFGPTLQGAPAGPPTKGQPSNEQRQAAAAVASPGNTWNTVSNQHPPRRNSVSDGPQEETIVLASSTQPGEDGDTSRDDQPAVAHARVDIGEHINEIIRTAEGAARLVRSDAESDAVDIRAEAQDAANARLLEVEQETHTLLEDAQAYATETRQAVDTYATQKRRQADAEASRIQSEAESQARAVREAAEEMAKQIEAEARQTQTALRDETRAIETRLDSLARGVREAGSQLDALLQRSKNGESLLEALGVDRKRIPAAEQES